MISLPRIAICLALCVYCGVDVVHAQTNAANVPAPPTAELRPFERFFGRWSVSGPYAGQEFTGITEVRPAVKGWYVEWINDVGAPGINRELRQLITWDRKQARYPIWRFETFDRQDDLEDGNVRFEGDTLVMEWKRERFIVQNRMVLDGDTLRMLSFGVNPTTLARRPVGALVGTRIPTGADASVPANAQDSAEIRAIIAADSLLNAATERGDSATLDRLFAPEFILVSGRGHVVTRKDNLRTLLAELDFDVMRAFDFQVELFGQSAVVVHKGESCGRRGDTPFTGAGEGMHIFVKRAGQWQVAATHEGRRRIPTQRCPAAIPPR